MALLEKLSRHPAVVSALLFAGTILLFGRAAWFGFVNVDDTDYVLGNPHVQRGLGADAIAWALTGVHSANWHPLTWVSHMADFAVFGAEPGGHHAVNVVWHGLNAVLAFLALRRLTGATATSAACAALFAWHPLRAESVAWVSERKDVLSGFFFFATLWLWAGWASSRRDARMPRAASYALALVAFALGLASKPMLVTLPFVLLLLDWWPLGRLRLGGDAAVAGDDRGRTSRREEAAARLLLEKAPLFLLSGAAAIATYLAQDAGGAMLRAIPLDARLGNAVVSVARYLGKLVWPFGLSIMYPYPERWSAAAVAGALSLVVGATALALWQWRRRPWLVVGWLWFLGMLVPVLGLVQVGVQAMADRYTYLPIVGLQVAILWTVRDLVAGSATRSRIAAATAAALLLLLAARTWAQVGVWRSSATLFAHATAVNEDSYLAHSNYGLALAEENRHAEAEQSFRRVLEIDPPHFTAETLRQNEYTVRYALGVMLLRQQRFDEAGEQLRRVLELVPDHLDANSHYGAILAMQGRIDEARARFETALRYNPSSAPAHANLARVEMMQGNVEGAVRGYQRSIELEPADPAAHCGLAEALQRAGRGDEAARHRAEARRLVGDPQACPG